MEIQNGSGQEAHESRGIQKPWIEHDSAIDLGLALGLTHMLTGTRFSEAMG
jgi:hypothetical protein